MVTQPDARAGRGRSLRPPPVKELAAEHGIPALQPSRLRDRAAIAQITSLKPDLQIVAAYGQNHPGLRFSICRSRERSTFMRHCCLGGGARRRSRPRSCMATRRPG